MKYISTRASKAKDDSVFVGFEDVVMSGLAPDGGLYIPSNIPQLSSQDLKDLRGKIFNEVVLFVMRRFVDEQEVSTDVLETLIQKSYCSFRSDVVCPVVQINEKQWILELFHGPTYAFKDIALQFLGNLVEYLLSRQESTKQLTVLGATSGDTGAAAIYGFRGKENVRVFILHPFKKTSRFQEVQMTSVLDDNVTNVAVDRTFDDCQAMVKELFGDEEYRKKLNLTAVNSINWARILAQITYYFFAYFQVTKNEDIAVDFSVPTGNFGDILAGFCAKQMGLPIRRLVIASNKNDILTRFMETGVYEKSEVYQTLAPAMDIQVSSNFERLLWHMASESGSPNPGIEVQGWISQLSKCGEFEVSKDELSWCREIFLSQSVSDEEIKQSIKEVYEKYGYLLDPHSAVGWSALEKCKDEYSSNLCISISTAHPIKFLPAIYSSIEPESKSEDPDFEERIFSNQKDDSLVQVPPEFVGIFNKPTRCIRIPVSSSELRKLLEFKS
jgi:threonine synthase